MSKQTDKNKRMGADPLSWIKDSRDAESENTGKQSNNSNTGLQKNKEFKSNTTQEGLQRGWKRATFIVREKHLDNIKSHAYWERLDLKEVLDEALTAYFENKRIKPIPARRRGA
jgi:hypothetical protein